MYTTLTHLKVKTLLLLSLLFRSEFDQPFKLADGNVQVQCSR